MTFWRTNEGGNLHMENTFLKKIATSNLTRAQLSIADYIAKNQKRILNMTAQEIGHAIGVSDASVIRFSRAVGYEGFSDLREHIRQELKEHSEKIGKHSLFDRFVMQTERYQNVEGTRNEMLRLMGINLESSLRQHEEWRYEEVADHILKANRKMVIGIRGGSGCAAQFSRLLGHITSNVECITNEAHDQMSKLMELGKEDVVIFLNFPRYYLVDEQMGSIINKNQVTVQYPISQK
ncbi:MAG: MurR/RpiR family transcriptional regulator [Clostridia bacterium]|nr:MurR/RpiR family transcriptional regulator [Clostridia bacterium]NCC45215.1 MurR/RpiR family transcriptional regulator [Clostridia bacterium]